MPVYTWSTTAASNATADSTINWAEGMAPSAVNDSARAQMAAEKKFYNDALTMAHTTAGTSTAYTLTTDSGFDTLAHLDKQMLTFVPHATSGASPTLNVDGLGAKAVNGPNGTAIATGALISGNAYAVLYDNTNNQFLLLNYRDTFINATVTGTLGVTGVATFTAVPVFSAGIGAATATTQGNSDNSTKVATTAYVTSSVAATYAPLASPTLTGSPKAPTASAGDNSTAIATTAFVNQAPGAFGNAYLWVRDEETSGTNGGTFTAGAWRTRVLNTVKVNTISSATLSSNTVSLPAGTYYARGTGPTNNCGTHKLKIVNTTDSADLIIGQNFESFGSETPTNASVVGQFTLSGTKNVQLQHQGSSTQSGTGFGVACGFTSTIEVYAELEIWKVG